MTLLEELNAKLEELVQSKVLSLDGLSSLADLKSKLEAGDKRIATLLQNLETKEATIAELREKISDRNDIIQRWEGRDKELIARDSALKAREREIFNHEKTAAVSEARAEAYKEAMTIVFKPPLMRESVVRSSTKQELGTQSNNWNPPAAVLDSESSTTERTEE